ncbi:hypothetical protein CFC21_063495 [Triticum aestivum]|uniref:Uncharacterized protein n=4 Tax=Triticinae TaxID=1648030 RepID=A0A453J6H6_AEGTS|nr:hypothetical protein CFC21_063495 [Triticum aestivum]
MASQLVSLMKRLWSYLPSSLSSSRSDPPQQIPDPTGDGDHPPDAQAGHTPPVQQPSPPLPVSDLEHLPSSNHIECLDGALEPDLAGNMKLGSSTSFPRHKIYDPDGGN